MATYEVIVSNLGRVYETQSHEDALETFAHYVKLSKTGRGRSGAEDVTLMEDGEIAREYVSAQKKRDD